MKIQFIEVAEPRTGLGWESWVDSQGRFSMPSAGIAAVASLVREHDQIAYVDERVSVLPHKVDADVVAISTSTMYCGRAYELADKFRAEGKRVVIGGTHASLVPEHALPHADCVVAGEAEGIWPIVLDDLEKGSLKEIYHAPKSRVELAKLPQHAIELFDHPKYMVHAVQSARGCSFGCEFCPTRTIFGDKFRLRALETVTSNVERLLAIEDKPVFFTENVFGAGNLPFVTDLTQWLADHRVRFGVICDWFMLTQAIVDRLQKANCSLVCVNLTGREEPKEIKALEAISRAGIPIWGYYMFGFEEDTPDVFERAIERANKYNIVCTTLTVLTPFPGTPMGERLRREGRVTSEDLTLYDHSHVLIKPKLMTHQQLVDGFAYVCDELSDRTNFSHAAKVAEMGFGAR